MVNAYGYFSGTLGWARYASRFYAAIAKLTAVRLIEFDRRGSPAPDGVGVGVGPIAQMSQVRGRKRIGVVFWETSRLPEAKLGMLNVLDELWTPSHWGRDCLIRNGFDSDRVHVVPGGVDVDTFRPASNRRASNGVFRFLCVGRWTVRKGVDDLVRAFCEEFQPNENVELILHCHNPLVPRFDLNAAIARAVNAPNARVWPSAPVQSGDLSALYQNADAFVLATRSEGWGLPVLEAMACGLPVIVTNYSAPADYVDHAIGYPVEVEKMVEVCDAQFFPEGSANGMWGQPDLSHLRRCMRTVFEHRDEAREKGRRARAAVEQRWTWERSAEIACRRIGELQ